MNKRIHKLLLMMVVFALAATLLPMYAYATTVSVLDGKVSISDNKNNISVSNGVVTVKGNGGLFGGTTNTVTITNETDTKSKLTFSYSASTYSSFSENSASGSKSADLEAGASITMSIKGTSGLGNKAGVLTLSNFNLVPIADTSNVTYEYDSTLGSVTAGGTAIASGVIQAVSGETGVALVATPVNNARFLGWINAADGTVLSTATSYTLIPAQTMTVKAVFAKDGGIPWFGVGATTQKSQSCGTAHMQKIYYHEVGVTHLFDDLNAAAAVAGGKAVVLMNDATLPAGDYTIPASVTLLIPFDTANTIYTVGAQYTGTYTQPSEYRTLTMAEGANLVINGAMSVSAKQKYAEGGSTQGGVPVGNTGFVRMNEGSTITVNNGGALYAYGYIIGSGTVTAKNGSTVYEGFQLMDFRGGAQSSGMKNNVFPMSQYYVQNIEVPLTLEAGATEHAYTWMMMSIKIDQYYYNSDIAFIGSDKAMFKISSGSVTKRYDPDTDRLIIEVDGDLDVSSVSLTFDSSGSISSEKYVLGLNGNISVIVNSGTININQDLAFLPGAHMTIGKDASVVIGQGKRLYVYDKDQWGAYVHLANTAEATARPLIYVPTRNPQKIEDTSGSHLTDASIVIEGTLDASNGSIYTTASGAQITGSNGGMIMTKPGSETITYQIKDQKTSNDPKDTEYAEIPITPAKLVNNNTDPGTEDNDYTETASYAGTYFYNSEIGKWYNWTVEVKDKEETVLATHYVMNGETIPATEGFDKYYTDNTFDKAFPLDSSIGDNTTVYVMTEAPLFDIYGTSVQAGDSLAMYFYVLKEDLVALDEGAASTEGVYYATVTHQKHDAENTVVEETIEGKLYNDTYYRFRFYGVAAKEMADELQVVIYQETGETDTPVSKIYTESVEKYAADLLNAIGTGADVDGTNALLRTALVDMLNYGAACQTEFTYNTENLANASIGDYQTFATATLDSSNVAAEGDKYYFSEQTVTTDSALVYTFHFLNVDPDTMEARISYKDHYGKSVERTVAIDEQGRVDVTGLAIADCNQTITCTIVYKESGNTVTTATGSIAAYANKAIELRIADATCETLMKFAQSAYKYLHVVIKSA